MMDYGRFTNNSKVISLDTSPITPYHSHPNQGGPMSPSDIAASSPDNPGFMTRDPGQQGKRNPPPETWQSDGGKPTRVNSGSAPKPIE